MSEIEQYTCCARCDVPIAAGTGTATERGWESIHGYCNSCAKRFPDSLLKATVDPFEYAMKLRTGETILFSEAALNGRWVTLTLHPANHSLAVRAGQPILAPRGLEVRLDDIVWCCDAPFGS